MQEVALPLAPCVRRGAIVATVACSAMPLGLQLSPITSAIAVISILMTGITLWWRYEALRPISLSPATAGRLTCRRRDGRAVDVAEIHIGISSPSLISATLRTTDRRSTQLFVPACALTDEEHWRLRRLVMGWRAPGGEATGR